MMNSNSSCSMKTVFKYFAISAIAILAAACNKEQTESVPQNENGFVYTFGFANGDADLLGTRATFASDEGGMYVDFEEGDYINSYAYSTTEEKYSYNKQGAINYNQNPVTFQVISHYALVVGDEVYCHFPYSNSGNTPKTANLSIKSAQTQSGNKYDASAAPMVSAPFQVKEAFNAKEEKTVGEIKFYNLASVIELDIFSPNGTYSSESITGISFVANDAICGNFSFDLTAVDTGDLTTLGITDLSGTAVNLTVSDALNVGSATNKDNAVKAYLVVAPGTHSGTLTVTTSVAQYTYTIPSRDFNRAEIRKFGINLEKEGARQVIRDVEYTLVESATNIVAGANYLVVSHIANGNTYWAMSSFNGANYYEAYQVTPNSGTITVSSDKIVSITLEDAGDGYFYLKDSDNMYIKAVSGNNLQRAASYDGDTFKWTVATDGITNKGLSTREIRFNGSASPKRFAGYTGTQNAIALYVDEATIVHEPTIIVTPATIEVDYKGGSFSDLSYELQNLEGEVVITFDGEIVTSAMGDPETAGGINYLVSPNGTEGDREGWIKISVGTVETVVPVNQYGAPSHDIIFLDGVTDEGVVYVGPNVNDETTISVLSSYYWFAEAVCDGVDNSFEIDPEEGNENDEESDVTEITISAKVANDGEERYLGDITIDNDGDEPTIISVWQRAVAVTPDPETIDFSTLGLSNGVAYNEPFNGGHFTVTFASGGNNGKYYTTGTALRAYSGGSFTVVSTDYPIAKIELTFGDGDNSNTITADVGTYSEPTWTGNSNSVTFSVGGTSGHRRIKAIKVTYVSDSGSGGETITVEKPTFSVAGGTYTSTQNVSISCATEGATIYYTIDGTTPDNTKTPYASALTISSTTTVKAIAIKDGVSSEIAEVTYTINSGGSDPVTVTFIAGTDTGASSVTKNGITVSMSTMSRTDNYRAYANSSMTVASTVGQISRVVVTCTGSGNGENGPGKFSGSGYSYSGNIGTWSGSSTSVTLSASAQVRMTKIEVTYTPAN